MCPSVRPSVRPSVCSLLRYHLNVFFVPTSQREMFKKFRVIESLGNSNGKKWSKIWKILLIKDVKSPHKKSFFFCCKFCLTEQDAGCGFFFTFINHLFWNFTIASWILLLPKRVGGTTISHMQFNLCCTSHRGIVSSKVIFYNLLRKIVKPAANILVMWTLF